MNEKNLRVIHNIFWILLFASLAVNITAICLYIRYSKHSGESDQGAEYEIDGADGSIKSAAGLIESGNSGLESVGKKLSDGIGTADSLTDSIKSSQKGCGDIESTIGTLRSQIEVLENNWNSGGGGGDNNNNSPTN